MDNFQFEAFKLQLDKLEELATEQAIERHNYLKMKSDELYQRCKYQNHDVKVFAEYLSDIGKGLIPIPEITEHCFPNYETFRTYKDGSFESGDYEVYQLWVMKQLNPQVMSKPSKKKIRTLIYRNLIVLGGGSLGALFIGYCLYFLFNVGIVQPTKNFAAWWQEERQIDSPWQRQPYTVYTLEELKQREQRNQNND